MSLLNQVKTTRLKKPLAILVYGTHGIGKTTLPSESEKPIYVGPEENDDFDIARLPRITAWAQLEEQLKALRDESHDYKTLVLDTVDTLEQVAEHDILRGAPGKTMTTAFGGFGKAYDKMANMFLNLRDSYLVPLRDKKGMNIVLLCHSKKRKHEDPVSNASYDCYETALHKQIMPIFEDWVSAILFVHYPLIKLERASDGKEIVEGMNGERIIYTQERPSHVAKNRFSLPYEVKFPKSGAWGVLQNHIDNYFGKPEKEIASDELALLEKEADDLLKKMPEDIGASIELSIKRAKKSKNEAELQRIITKMKGALK